MKPRGIDAFGAVAFAAAQPSSPETSHGRALDACHWSIQREWLARKPRIFVGLARRQARRPDTLFTFNLWP